MAGTRGRPDAPVTAQLAREPAGFDFFEAVRILHARRGKGAPIGEDTAAAREAVRFRALPSTAFPPGAVTGWKDGKSGDGGDAAPTRPEMLVAFFGLFGPSGALPQHYTEQIVRANRARNTELGAFLDLFNHRLVSLFWRAWEKYRLPAAYERQARAGGRDPIGRSLAAVAGIGTPHLDGRLAVADETVLHYAGLLSAGSRSVAGLESMLSDYFARPVRVEQFVGAWCRLAEDERTVLPGRAAPHGRHCRLGREAVVGARVWDVQGRFEIRVGPLTLAQFLDFMPGRNALRRLGDLARLHVGPGLSFAVRLSLLRREVPPCRLGGGAAARLGWTSWLISAAPFHDPDDAVFDLDSE
jgi:type VI secretion system protein ImpH